MSKFPPPNSEHKGVEERLGKVDDSIKEGLASTAKKIDQVAASINKNAAINRTNWPLPLVLALGFMALAWPLWRVLLFPPITQMQNQCYAEVTPPKVLKSLEFTGPPFTSGCHLHCKNSHCRDGAKWITGDEKSITEFLSARPEIVFWQLQTGHDLDELSKEARATYKSNLGLASARSEFLRQMLGDSDPIFVVITAGHGTTEAQKQRDRMPRLTAMFYAQDQPTPTPALQLIPCPISTLTEQRKLK